MNSHHADQLRTLRREHPLSEVALGYRTVSLVEPDELAEAQLGYALDPGGRDLTGVGEGDWSPDWLVIAREDQNGDPIFVDTSSRDWPVYTAPHGTGTWDPERIADSFPKFLAALALVRGLAIGRESPVALEGNPLSDLERVRLLKQIERANPRAELGFWETWLES